MISQSEMMEDHNNQRRHKEWQEKQARLAKNPSECQYLDILRRIMSEGIQTPNRTGIDTLTVPHIMWQHDMKNGFPLFTTRKLPFKSIKVELNGFIQGIRSKKWYQERGCGFWSGWASPAKIPKGLSDIERKQAQLLEDDLGPIYNWRRFNDSDLPEADQLKTIVETLHTNPNDRRMVCSSVNPLQMKDMALPPCHYSWNVIVIKDTLHLCWTQRSVDSGCGLPANCASYALLLHLLAKEGGFKEGLLTGFLMNVHLYMNQLDGAKEQIEREPFPCPKIETKNFKSIFDWDYSHTKLLDYQSHEKIYFPVAV